MAKKRNSDTEIWRDPWYRMLSVEYKCFWKYICDNCDDAGVWKEDMDLAVFQIRGTVEKGIALEVFNKDKDRILEFKTGYWLIVDFISFHCGELKDTNNYHNHIIRLVRNHGIEGLVRGSSAPISKGKGNSKDKDLNVVQKQKSDSFSKFWSAYPRKKSKGQAEKAWKKLNPDEQLQDRILRAIERAKTSRDWVRDAGEYIPHPSTWLNAKGWEDEPEVKVGTKKNLKTRQEM